MTRTVAQLVAAEVVMLGGAWLVGWWAVGVVLFLFGVCLALDAVLRNDERPDVSELKRQLSDDVLERWRRAR